MNQSYLRMMKKRGISIILTVRSYLWSRWPRIWWIKLSLLVEVCLWSPVTLKLAMLRKSFNDWSSRLDPSNLAIATKGVVKLKTCADTFVPVKSLVDRLLCWWFLWSISSRPGWYGMKGWYWWSFLMWGLCVFFVGLPRHSWGFWMYDWLMSGWVYSRVVSGWSIDIF